MMKWLSLYDTLIKERGSRAFLNLTIFKTFALPYYLKLEVK